MESKKKISAMISEPSEKKLKETSNKYNISQSKIVEEAILYYALYREVTDKARQEKIYF